MRATRVAHAARRRATASTTRSGHGRILAVAGVRRPRRARRIARRLSIDSQPARRVAALRRPTPGATESDGAGTTSTRADQSDLGATPTGRHGSPLSGAWSIAPADAASSAPAAPRVVRVRDPHFGRSVAGSRSDARIRGTAGGSSHSRPSPLGTSTRSWTVASPTSATSDWYPDRCRRSRSQRIWRRSDRDRSRRRREDGHPRPDLRDAVGVGLAPALRRALAASWPSVRGRPVGPWRYEQVFATLVAVEPHQTSLLGVGVRPSIPTRRLTDLARRALLGRLRAELAARRRHAARRARRVGRVAAGPALDVRPHGRRPAAHLPLRRAPRPGAAPGAGRGPRRARGAVRRPAQRARRSTTTATGATASRPHADRELRELDDTLVAILTLGARRPFLVRPKAGGPSRDLAPGSGDLLVMGGATQLDWEHAVPKVARSGPRVSVSWRWSSAAAPAAPAPGHAGGAP